MRAQTVLFESEVLRVRAVHCVAAPSPEGPVEWSAANTVVFRRWRPIRSAYSGFRLR